MNGSSGSIQLKEGEKWLSNFPRLFDLYQRSQKGNPRNYFNFKELFPIVYVGSEAYADIETVLAKLDEMSWERLSKKALSCITADDPLRRYHQLFNALNEARGYVYLASEGYEQIEFIEDQSRKSPDLLAHKANSLAILEVKTVNQSDEDLAEESLRGGEAIVVEPKLSDRFKSRILRSIRDAREQLDTYPNATDKKIVFLFVHMKSTQRTCGESYAELKSVIDDQNTDGIEVIHQATP